MTVLRFPGLLPGNSDVPSILYYDKSGNVKAAGAEALLESVVDTALTEGWVMAEGLVIDHVGTSYNLLIRGTQVEASFMSEISTVVHHQGR